jgi:hypothetical protein
MKNKEADLRKQNKEKEKRADELDILNEEHISLRKQDLLESQAIIKGT